MTDTLYDYTGVFIGRQRGALGIFHVCQQTVRATDEGAAELALYDTHEHIQGLRWVQVTPVPQETR